LTVKTIRAETALEALQCSTAAFVALKAHYRGAIEHNHRRQLQPTTAECSSSSSRARGTTKIDNRQQVSEGGIHRKVYLAVKPAECILGSST
jgi:hypothetical protein